MADDKNRIERIYSRSRLKFPELRFFTESKNNVSKQKTRKVIKIFSVLIISFLVANTLIDIIEPIIDAQCINTAKAIATKISNEQASLVMNNYQYEDLMNVTKDSEGNVKMISANMIIINKIVSDIPVKIQEELNKVENGHFFIKMGNFTGSKFFSGRGPDIEIKVSVVGNIETSLKSEFIEAGINQTLHRVYLEVRCNTVILTPFDNIEEQIINQVLLAEGIIVGNIPTTYYDLENLNKDNAVDIIE